MRDAAGRSRCFAFLTFEEPASVNAVMVREHVLDGKIVRLIFFCYDYPICIMAGLDNTVSSLFFDHISFFPFLS
jgi:hypothetical protein